MDEPTSTLPPPQPPRVVTDRERALRRAGADLCRAHPAIWSAMVRYGDQLVREGWEKDVADLIAWAFFVEGRRWWPGQGAEPDPTGWRLAQDRSSSTAGPGWA